MFQNSRSPTRPRLILRYDQISPLTEPALEPFRRIRDPTSLHLHVSVSVSQTRMTLERFPFSLGWTLHRCYPDAEMETITPVAPNHFHQSHLSSAKSEESTILTAARPCHDMHLPLHFRPTPASSEGDPPFGFRCDRRRKRRTQGRKPHGGIGPSCRFPPVGSSLRR
jgi:hypothetical protein